MEMMYDPYTQINSLVYEMFVATMDRNAIYESKDSGQKLVSFPDQSPLSVQEKTIKSLMTKDSELMIFI